MPRTQFVVSVVQSLRLAALLTIFFSTAGQARELSSSFDVDLGSLYVFPADCGPDEIHEDCDVLELSCSAIEGGDVYSFGASVQRLSDEILAKWLVSNGATLVLTNGSRTLELFPVSIARDGYDGSWDVELASQPQAIVWLKAIERGTQIVAHFARGDWVVPSESAKDIVNVEGFLGLCIARIDEHG